MASIVDSFREVFSDNLSFLKILVLAIPVYYSFQLYIEAKGNFSGFFGVLFITLFFLLGFLTKITTNVVGEKDSILPSLNPFKLAFASIKSILAVGPLTLISCLLANYICSLINILQWVDFTFKFIIWLFVAAIIITSFLMYSTKERIADAYNISVLFLRAGDLMVVILFFIIQLIVINIPTIGFIGYTVLVLFGFGPVFNLFLALGLVFNIAVFGHYLGQVHYENITYNINSPR